MDAAARAAGHVIVAPDKFKGTLTAPQAASHIAAGLRRASPGTPVVVLPVADGGEGTVDCLVTARAAGFRRVGATVAGPTGRPAGASFALGAAAAVVEAAQACGLSRLPGGRPAPLTATSQGVGELLGAAAAAGARSIVLALGGVACTDGGAGMVTALGGHLLDRSGARLPPGGAALSSLHRLRLPGPPPLVPVRVVAACDVDNPLLGAAGAAAVYAPQKGAGPQDVAALERGLTRWADVAERVLGRRYRDVPGAGAAGGLGFAALAFLGATVRPGIELLLEHVGFARRLQGARLVITGEGSLDAQTLRGKAPAGVARAAAAAGVPVVAVTGTAALAADDLRGAGISAVYSLAGVQPDVQRRMAEAGPLLEELAQRLARDWLA